jgi:serine/threonine protein kinase
VLKLDDDIRSPADELYTLEDVRAAHPAGLDARDVAWIWRRLLSVLGFAHTQGVIHGQILPMHVLIEPREHKLVLVDWCAAVPQAPPRAKGLSIISSGHRAWYRREIALTDPPSPALDIALAARCMIELLGGDPIDETFPPSVDPAIQRHFQRCLGSASGKRPDAPKLLEDFDRLIEALWGPRKFRVLEMPPKQRGRA